MALIYCNRFAASPDHWRSKQASKESTYKEFYATFGSSDTKTTKNDGFLADTSNNKSNPNNVKEMRKEIDQSLGSSSFLSTDGFNRNPKKAKQKNKKNAEIGGNEDDSGRKKKRSKKEKVESGHDIAAAAAEVARKTAKKRQRNRDVSEAYGKKLKTSD
jgi:nucleolar protein 9